MTDNLKTIYVEDDEQEAFIMTIGMRRQGVDILLVVDATSDNIALLQVPPYDKASALIFDAILAGASGVELAVKLRESGEQRTIILLTAGENPDARRLASLNIYYMRKPPNYATLAEMIRQGMLD
jgi:DNA-binding response OmpR family regulator